MKNIFDSLEKQFQSTNKTKPMIGSPESALTSSIDLMKAHHEMERLKESEQISREEKQIELLEDIKNNTGSLVNMVDMIRFNSDQQTEIMLVIADILAIGTATTPEEAESLYKKTMDKINRTIESGENIAKLTAWATTAWNIIDKFPL